MDKAALVELLQNNGYDVTACDRLGNDSGWQIRCRTGEIVNAYDSGAIVVQGKNQQQMRTLLGQSPVSPAPPTSGAGAAPRNVFVVYGHDAQARNELEAMLRRWGLNPLILDQLPSGGQTLIEKLESVRSQASFAVVLATPDDEGHRAGHPDEQAYRARQNVVLELGMMLSILGRDRVAILLKDQVNMERPSDIQGLIYIPFKDELKDAALPLAKEINARGIQIDLGRV